jgi:hypothetical protein
METKMSQLEQTKGSERVRILQLQVEALRDRVGELDKELGE